MIDIGAFECDYWPSYMLDNAWSLTIESGSGFLL